MALVQHHTDSSMKCKKNQCFYRVCFSPMRQTRKHQHRFFFFFFSYLSPVVFFILQVWNFILQWSLDEMSYHSGDLQQVLLKHRYLALTLQPGKSQSCILTGSTVVGRQKRGRRKELKACAGQIHQQTNQAAGVHNMMQLLNCS